MMDILQISSILSTFSHRPLLATKQYQDTEYGLLCSACSAFQQQCCCRSGTATRSARQFRQKLTPEISTEFLTRGRSRAARALRNHGPSASQEESPPNPALHWSSQAIGFSNAISRIQSSSNSLPAGSGRILAATVPRCF